LIWKGKLYNAYWQYDRSPSRENIARIGEWVGAGATRATIAAAADRARSPLERDALTEIYLRWLPPD
jgi:hypothetical protein